MAAQDKLSKLASNVCPICGDAALVATPTEGRYQCDLCGSIVLSAVWNKVTLGILKELK